MSTYESFLPGVYSKETNCKIYYAHIVAVFIVLIFIMIITITALVNINSVNETLNETQTLVNAMNTLLPDAKFGIELLNLLCGNTNFTNYYPNVLTICKDKISRR